MWVRPLASERPNEPFGARRRQDDSITSAEFQRTTKDRVEKQQATEELAICDRKMAWMANHKNYDHAEALCGIEKLKKNWRTAA